MKKQKIFDSSMWASVGMDLRGGAFRWWEKNEKALVGLEIEEARDIAHALKARNRLRAKRILAKYMLRDEWVAQRNGTTNTLARIANRRAAAKDAIEDLGWWAAKSVGVAILGALGL